MKEQVSVDDENCSCPNCGINQKQFMLLLAKAAEYEKCIDVKQYCTIPISNYNALVEERDKLKRLDANVKNKIKEYKAKEESETGDIERKVACAKIWRVLESLNNG